MEDTAFVPAAFSLISCTTLTPTARLTYLLLQMRATQAGGDGLHLEATAAEVAVDLGVAVNTASRALEELEAVKLIQRHWRGQGRPSQFTLTAIPLRST